MNVDQLMSIFESVGRTQRPSSSSSGVVPLLKKKCSSCEDEERITPDRLCHVCGEELVEIRPPPVAMDPVRDGINRGDVDSSFFDLLGDDLRAAIAASLQQGAPSRQISPEYLSTLGKVTLDTRRGLLYDTILSIGPLNIMVVPASFGPLPSSDTILTTSLILGNPEFGDVSPLINHLSCTGAIVVLKRGKVSFATKAMTAQQSGAVACVVINTTDIWPFAMTDSTHELEHDALTIPILMISQSDGDVVEGTQSYLLTISTMI